MIKVVLNLIAAAKTSFTLPEQLVKFSGSNLTINAKFGDLIFNNGKPQESFATPSYEVCSAMTNAQWQN